MNALKYIAKIQTDFPTKFGIPRQSGLVNTKGTIVFEPEYRKEEALKGLEECSHLWLIWEFSEAVRTGWSPTVRLPRLGGINGAVCLQPDHRSVRIRSDYPV